MYVHTLNITFFHFLFNNVLQNRGDRSELQIKLNITLNFVLRYFCVRDRRFNAITKSLRVRGDNCVGTQFCRVIFVTRQYIFRRLNFVYIRASVRAALSLKFRHIYSVGWKYSPAHRRIASATFEWSRADFYGIEDFNIKDLCREQKLRTPLRLESNACSSAKTGQPKMIRARAYVRVLLILFALHLKMIYASKSIICSLIFSSVL